MKLPRAGAIPGRASKALKGDLPIHQPRGSKDKSVAGFEVPGQNVGEACPQPDEQSLAVDAKGIRSLPKGHVDVCALVEFLPPVEAVSEMRQGPFACRFATPINRIERGSQEPASMTARYRAIGRDTIERRRYGAPVLAQLNSQR
ncbi:hypothetical protein [Mesorhizobium sp. Root552]|uniref:hypothetical protein n=1 Tax=Mesorhizobium sp. Root552 TaxID=1736555 RepID=UPI0012E8C566|nr:hypothetical protein [Mesorhizobium sp. Root552]